MKNEPDKIDDLFRQKLEGYQVDPSGKVWKNILSRYLHPQSGPFHLLNLQNIIGAVILAGAGITAYVLLHSSITSKMPEDKILSGSLVEQSGSNNRLTSQDPLPISIPSENDQANPVEATVHQTNSRPQSTLIREDTETGNEDAGQKTSPEINEASPVEYLTNESIHQLSTLPSLAELASSGEGQRFVVSRRNLMQNIDIQMRKQDYRKPVHIAAGLYFFPEWTDYRNQAKNFQSGYTQEILASVQMGKFIIRPGFGITRSQDDGNYEISYNKYEMTGYYLGVDFDTYGIPSDSMSYVLNEYGLYDTVFYSDSYRTDNACTYLQIPLQIGYEFLNFKRFSMMVAGGPCLSLLLNEKKSDPAFRDFAAENIMMVDQTPERKYSNWQLLLGLSSKYMITGKFSLSLEPTYRQYFNSTYEGDGTGRPPYSFGIRAGMTYHF